MSDGSRGTKTPSLAPPLPGPGASEPPSAGRNQVICAGGGRGGVGKSVIAQNLAIYFAQMGRSVLLVDADFSGGNLHRRFGLPSSRVRARDERMTQSAIKSWIIDTPVPGLRLLPAPMDAAAVAGRMRGAQKSRFLSTLRELDFDYVVIDVGAGAHPLALDAMLEAQLAICVTVPEPPAIEATYDFIRAAFERRMRKLLSSDKLRTSMLDRALAEQGGAPVPLDFVRALERIDPSLGELAWQMARSFHFYLVVNQTRVRSDLDLGTWIRELVDRHYGIDIDELGHVEHDDTVWLSTRRSKALLVDSPASKAARNVERIGRRITAVLQSPAALPVGEKPPAELSLYDYLAVTRTASDEEIRRAFKRQKEIYAADSVVATPLLSGEAWERVIGKLSEAYDTLLDPIRRHAYDLSTFGEQPDKEPEVEAPKPAELAERRMLQDELAREIGPDTDFSGLLLRKVREAHGIDIAAISQTTKIGQSYLEAIEREEFDKLPATVYVRGFLIELAKYLRLDSAQVQRTFLRRRRDALKAAGKEVS